MAHGNAVVDGDGVEFRSETPLLGDQLFQVLPDVVQMDMARDELGKRVDYADDRLAELFVGHAVCPPETPGARHFSSQGCRCAA